MLQRLQSIHPQVWVAIGTFTIIAASAYPVFSKDTREGHDLFSSEKPAAIREAQEAREQEYRRQMLQRRAQLQADQQELEHQLQQQQQRQQQQPQTKSNGKQ